MRGIRSAGYLFEAVQGSSVVVARARQVGQHASQEEWAQAVHAAAEQGEARQEGGLRERERAQVSLTMMWTRTGLRSLSPCAQHMTLLALHWGSAPATMHQTKNYSMRSGLMNAARAARVKRSSLAWLQRGNRWRSESESRGR